jgi:enamine deaminase RidA (YjgF/YER057c/UK114 family)
MGGQATRVFENLRSLAEAAGGRFSDIVQFDIYYADQALYHDYNEARVRFLEANVPDKDWFAGSGVRAGSTISGALIEIEAIAAIAAPGQGTAPLMQSNGHTATLQVSKGQL